MAEEYDMIEKLLLDVDFTKGSSHKDRLRDKLFGADASDELDFDELANVQAAVRSFDGIRKT